ncbi:MAG: hypothetical protein FJ077_12840 [Cyanobacteria bacterium K_DeepCast_35m_m2_023]|nr:hypothetical protein [Cyanobacteria bacterium K_DeepCast_35m_m2_023]
MKIIYTNNEGGVSVIHPTGELSIEEVAAKDVPEGLAYEIVEDDAIPSDRTFRGAWVAAGAAVEVDLDQAKEIGHDKRRAARAEEFAPLDRVISLQLPGMDTTAAEAGRQLIRDKYAQVQADIDAAASPDEIKAALGLD